MRHSFDDQLADHADEARVSADGGGADHVDAELVAKLAGFRVEIVEHFQMVGDEADRRDDDVLQLGSVVLFAQEVADVRLEPRLLRRAAAALVDQVPVVSSDASATSRQASRSCNSYRQPSAIACGIECAVKMSDAAARRSAGICANAAFVSSIIGSMKPG